MLQALVNSACSEGLLSLLINQPAFEDFPIIQYADDTLIVLPADFGELQSLKNILDAYANATGMKINYHKSQLVQINVDTARANDLASVLGCQVGTIPFTYLGLALGTSRPTVAELMPLVDRVERRLTSTAI